MNFLIRVVELLNRFLESIQQVGFKNTTRIFSYLFNLDKEKYISFNKKKFYFFPKSDKGVISHFYIEGYKINGRVKLIFDIGANIGTETLRFLHLNPNSRIISVEPSTRNFYLLNKNFKDENRVSILKGALWHESKDLLLKMDQTFESFKITENESEKEELYEKVRGYTIPEILELNSLKGAVIDILKIDVEGAEKNIFCNGDNSWLDKVNSIIMEMPDGDTPFSFQKIMNEFNRIHLKGKSYICGENYIFIKKGSNLNLEIIKGFNK